MRDWDRGKESSGIWERRGEGRCRAQEEKKQVILESQGTAAPPGQLEPKESCIPDRHFLKYPHCRPLFDSTASFVASWGFKKKKIRAKRDGTNNAGEGPRKAFRWKSDLSFSIAPS